MGVKITKYLLQIFCFAFFVGGTSMLALGFRARNALDFFTLLTLNIDDPNEKDLTLGNAIKIIIGAGFCLVLASVVGFYAALEKQKRELYYFVALILVVFCIETGGSMLFFINQPSFDELVLNTMKYYNYADRNPKSQSYQLTKAWRKYQDENLCCGWDEPKDWERQTNKKLDETFCTSSGRSWTLSKAYEYEGCRRYFYKYIYPAANTTLAMMFLQMMSITFSCKLIRRINKGAERDAKAGLEQEEQPAKKKEVVADAGEDTTRELVEETVVDVEEYDMTTHE